MSQKMNEYLHSSDGRKLSRAERLQRLKDIPFAVPKIETSVPEGRSADRQKARHQTSLLQQEISAQIKSDAVASKPATNPYVSRVVDLESQLQWAIASERGGIERRLMLFKQEAAKWEADKATAERRATFEASTDFQRVREHHVAFMKSRELVHPDLTEADILMLRAIASSDAYATPADQASAYFAAVSKCESLQCQRETERLAAAEQNAVKASTEFAAQKARTDAANARLAELGGTDAE